MQNNEPLVTTQNLTKHFVSYHGFMGKERHTLAAVDVVSFSIYPGETLGLVGESGCGKTTLGKTLLKLYPPTSGKIFFEKTDISTLSETKLFPFRKRMQMIFQDPYSSLNPRMTIAEIIGEPLEIHGLKTRRVRMEKVNELLAMVGLNKEHANRFPHEFSGGQRQRIGIARALAIEPQFIVCDEPISALDVSIQAQIINLLEALQEKLKLTYLFIAHDISMVKHISTRIAVMYLGKIVEIAGAEELYGNPLHPYTQALLSAVPVADPKVEANRKRIVLEGDVPSPINPPPGCGFRSRCCLVFEKCAQVTPELQEVHPGHQVSCWAVK